MATREAKAAKATRKADAASRPKVLPIRVVVDPTEDTPSYYTNYAEAALSAHELAISFARVPTKMSVEQTRKWDRGEIRLEPMVQVIFAPTLFPG